MSVKLSFDDALKGVTTKISVPQTVDCDACGGSGAAPGTSPITCPQCQGRGAVNVEPGFFAMTQACPRCGGAGTVIEDPVRGLQRHRDGPGAQEVHASLCPAGVKDGTKIRLKGKGEPGQRGGPPGDLYVIAQVEESPVFERRGADLVVEVPVTMVEAALGATVKRAHSRGECRPEGPGRHAERQDAQAERQRSSAPGRVGQGRPARPRQGR